MNVRRLMSVIPECAAAGAACAHSASAAHGRVPLLTATAMRSERRKLPLHFTGTALGTFEVAVGLRHFADLLVVASATLALVLIDGHGFILSFRRFVSAYARRAKLPYFRLAPRPTPQPQRDRGMTSATRDAPSADQVERRCRQSVRRLAAAQSGQRQSNAIRSVRLRLPIWLHWQPASPGIPPASTLEWCVPSEPGGSRRLATIPSQDASRLRTWISKRRAPSG